MAVKGGKTYPSGLFGSYNPASTQPSSDSNLFSNAYPASIKQTGEDYDEIMQGYRNILQTPTQLQQMQYSPLTPQRITPQTSPEATRALGMASEFARTGGFSGKDISNIRERGISPIRSVYANAMRNIDRQRRLSGGYSPNYNAVTAKMARELSSTLADKTTDVNAQLAQMIAGNKASGISAYLPAASRERDILNQIESENVGAFNRASEMNREQEMRVAEFNRMQQAQEQERQQRALQGMQSLYGTTPALASTFGNQALQSNAQRMEQDRLRLAAAQAAAQAAQAKQSANPYSSLGSTTYTSPRAKGISGNTSGIFQPYYSSSGIGSARGNWGR